MGGAPPDGVQRICQSRPPLESGSPPVRLDIQEFFRRLPPWGALAITPPLAFGE